MARDKKSLKDVIECEVHDLGDRVAGLAYLFMYLRPYGTSDTDDDGRAGVSVLLWDIHRRSRILSRILDLDDSISSEVEVERYDPDQLHRLMVEMEKNATVAGIRRALKSAGLSPDDRILQMKVEIAILDAERRGEHPSPDRALAAVIRASTPEEILTFASKTEKSG